MDDLVKTFFSHLPGVLSKVWCLRRRRLKWKVEDLDEIS